MIVKILKKTFTVFLNFLIFLIGLCVFKSKKYVLIGSWMGDRYADNSRYLFDYLFYNKKEAGIKKVIWATRSRTVYAELKANGFDVVLIGTLSSFYYHCKSGIHIICNTSVSSKAFLSDIDSMLSSGAKKVQLWHGNGIKRVPGKDSNRNVFYSFARCVSTPGLWYPQNALYLCKCDLDFAFFDQKFGVKKEKCIDANYPRTDTIVFKTNAEKELLSKIQQYTKIVIYLPTFRNDYSHFVHPLSNSILLEYLHNNNILWIEKPHLADKQKRSSSHSQSENVIILDEAFDINLIIPQCCVLITDYSSAMLDALFFRKQIIYYVPDYDDYLKNDRGFLMDYDSITISPKIFSISDLIKNLNEMIEAPSYSPNAERIRKMFWKHENWKCNRIWEEIQRACE